MATGTLTGPINAEDLNAESAEGRRFAENGDRRIKADVLGELIQREGWQRSDSHLDIDDPVAEQHHRQEIFDNMRRQCFVTDWDRVRTHLNMLRQSIAS